MAFGQAKLALSCQHDRIAASSSLLVDGWKAAGGEDARRRYVNSTDTGDRFGVIKEIELLDGLKTSHKDQSDQDKAATEPGIDAPNVWASQDIESTTVRITAFLFPA